MYCGSDNTGANIAFSQVSAKSQTQSRTGFWVFWFLDLELWALADSLQSACTTKTENNNRCTGVCSSSCLWYTTWLCGVIHILISGSGQEEKSNWIMNTSEAPFSLAKKDTLLCLRLFFSSSRSAESTRIHTAVFILLFSSDTHEYARECVPTGQAMMAPLNYWRKIWKKKQNGEWTRTAMRRWLNILGYKYLDMPHKTRRAVLLPLCAITAPQKKDLCSKVSLHQSRSLSVCRLSGYLSSSQI